MPAPPTHEDVVGRLIADADPVRPLWSPHARLAVWLILQVVTIIVAVEFGLRQDLGEHLRQPLFVLELGLLIVAGALSAAAALRVAVPGTTGESLAVAVAVPLVVTAVVLLSFQPAKAVDSLAAFVASGAQCLGSILAFSVIPWSVLFLAVRRGAPLDGPIAGAYVGAATFLFAAAAVRIACPIDERLHLLAWHTTAIAMGVALSGVAGAWWLDRWERARH